MGMGRSRNVNSNGLFAGSIKVPVPPVSKFNIVTVTFRDRMGRESIASIKDTVTIDTVLKCDNDFHGYGHVNVACEQTSRVRGPRDQRSEAMHT